MLRSKDKETVLHVFQDRAILVCQHQMAMEIVLECRFNEADPSQAIARCAERLPEKSSRLDVVLDDSHARIWQVVPAAGSTRLADLRAAASMRFAALFGQPANEWAIEAAWHATKPFLACAVPLRLMRQIESALHSRTRKVRLSACIPYFIHQWNRYAAIIGNQAEAFAVFNDDVVTLAFLDDASIRFIRMLRIDRRDPRSLQRLDRTVQSLSLQLGIEPPREILLAGGLDAFPEVCVIGSRQWRRIDSGLLAAVLPSSSLEDVA